MMQDETPRLSAKESVIMRFLVSGRREMYGLELVRCSDGVLKPGTIYVTLLRLEDKGYISSRREGDENGERSLRRLYKPTGLGAKVFGLRDQERGRLLRQALAP